MGAGWKLVALEWEKPDCLRLVENPTERQIIILALDMIVEDQPLSQAAEQLNRRGHRTRQGNNWTLAALFNLLPRMIEVGPRLFVSEEWTHRRERLPRVVWRLLSGRHGNFDARLGSRQPRDSYGGPRRPRVFEVGGVHCVHAREQVHVREIDLHRNRVLEAHARGFQNDPDSVQTGLDLGFEIVRYFLGLEVLADLSGHIQRSVHQNPGTEGRRRGAGGGRELGRCDHPSISRLSRRQQEGTYEK